MRALPFPTLAGLLLLAAPLTGQDLGDVLLQRTLDVGDGGRVVVDVADADIRVVSGGANVSVTVYVRARDDAWGREVFERMAFHVEASGTEARIEATDARIDGRDWRRHGGVGVTAVLRVPAGAALDLTSADGDIDVEGAFAEALLVRTSDGDVRVRGVRPTRLELRSSDGDLVVEDATAPELRLHTSDGDVRVEGVAGRLDVETSDGDVDVRIREFHGARLRSGDGDITLWLPSDADADVELRGEDLSTERALTIRGRIGEHRIEGTLGAGGPRLEVATGDGSIELRDAR